MESEATEPAMQHHLRLLVRSKGQGVIGDCRWHRCIDRAIRVAPLHCLLPALEARAPCWTKRHVNEASFSFVRLFTWLKYVRDRYANFNSVKETGRVSNARVRLHGSVQRAVGVGIGRDSDVHIRSVHSWCTCRRGDRRRHQPQTRLATVLGVGLGWIPGCAKPPPPPRSNGNAGRSEPRVRHASTRGGHPFCSFCWQHTPRHRTGIQFRQPATHLASVQCRLEFAVVP